MEELNELIYKIEIPITRQGENIIQIFGKKKTS
jgi:hypothetical protein